MPSDTNIDNQLADSSMTGYVSKYHRFGWLLFLALRVHVFGRFRALVTCTNGLISILVSHSCAYQFLNKCICIMFCVLSVSVLDISIYDKN